MKPKVRLRAMELEDIDVLLSWENTMDIWLVSDRHESVSRHQLRSFIDQTLSQDIYAQRQYRWMLEASWSSAWTTVGTLDLYDFDPYHRRAGVGIFLAEAFRRQGIAREALEALVNYGKDHLLLQQLWARIPESNQASRHLFEACGFELSGVFRRWLLGPDHTENVCFYQHIIHY